MRSQTEAGGGDHCGNEFQHGKEPECRRHRAGLGAVQGYQGAGKTPPQRPARRRPTGPTSRSGWSSRSRRRAAYHLPPGRPRRKRLASGLAATSPAGHGSASPTSEAKPKALTGPNVLTLRRQSRRWMKTGRLLNEPEWYIRVAAPTETTARLAWFGESNSLGQTTPGDRDNQTESRVSHWSKLLLPGFAEDSWSTSTSITRNPDSANRYRQRTTSNGGPPAGDRFADLKVKLHQRPAAGGGGAQRNWSKRYRDLLPSHRPGGSTRQATDSTIKPVLCGRRPPEHRRRRSPLRHQSGADA